MPKSSSTATLAPAADPTGATLDLVPAGIFEMDAAGQVRFVNRQLRTYSGLTAEASLGTGWIESIHPADRERVIAAWRDGVAAGREIALEFRFLRPDGSTMWAAGRASPILGTSGELTGYLGTVTDVSTVIEERREQDEQRRFLDAVLEIAGSLVCVFDGEGQILRFNRACEVLTGYTFEELEGRPFYDVLVPEAEIQAVRDDLAQLRPGQPPTQNENNWVTRDGRLRLIAWSDVCFFDDDGHATHLISTGIDVTDERRGDEALRGIEAVGALLATTGPTPESMAAVLHTLADRMGYPYLALFTKRGKRLELGAAVGYDGRAAELDPEVGIIGRAVQSGRSVRHEVSQIAVPLTIEREIVGVLSIESTPETPLTPADLRLIETVAGRLSVALALGREQGALKERARLFAALNAFAQAAARWPTRSSCPRRSWPASPTWCPTTRRGSRSSTRTAAATSSGPCAGRRSSRWRSGERSAPPTVRMPARSAVDRSWWSGWRVVARSGRRPFRGPSPPGRWSRSRSSTTRTSSARSWSAAPGRKPRSRSSSARCSRCWVRRPRSRPPMPASWRRSGRWRSATRSPGCSTGVISTPPWS